MQELNRYAVGIDVGTFKTRCVVASLDGSDQPRVIGVGVAPTSGMRKGVVVTLNGPARAIDEALGEAERMSGHQVHGALVSINGSHIVSTHADGMVAVGAVDHVIGQDDITRVEEVATIGKIPANREILDVTAHAYKLDGQDNIKDPIGMTGTRLEIDAHVISALTPHVQNLQKVAQDARVDPKAFVAPGIAAAKAVLSEQQKENGVALLDIGASTINIALYEEGDLRFISVVPLGGMQITNDLAIGLKVDPEHAEKIKLQHGSALVRRDNSGVSIKLDGEIISFDTREIDDIIEARLDEMFDAVTREIKRAGLYGRLPSGVVLVGGSSAMPHLVEYVKNRLGVAARLGKTSGFAGITDAVEGPEFATALGLMLIDSQSFDTSNLKNTKKNNMISPFSKLLSRFKV